MTSIFLSHASEDRGLAASIALFLTSRGHDVFYDAHLSAGEEWRNRIAVELRRSKCVVVLWTEYSVKSKWVCAEAGYALERRVLVPIKGRSLQVPLPFSEIQSIDYTGIIEAETYAILEKAVLRLSASSPEASTLSGDASTLMSVGSGANAHAIAILYYFDRQSGQLKSHGISIIDETITIGRGLHCTIPLEEPTLSREHCRIHVQVAFLGRTPHIRFELHAVADDAPVYKNGQQVKIIDYPWRGGGFTIKSLELLHGDRITLCPEVTLFFICQ